MTWLLNGPYEIEQLIFIFIIICSWYAGWILDFSSQYAALHQRFAKKILWEELTLLNYRKAG